MCMLLPVRDKENTGGSLHSQGKRLLSSVAGEAFAGLHEQKSANLPSAGLARCRTQDGGVVESAHREPSGVLPSVSRSKVRPEKRQKRESSERYGRAVCRSPVLFLLSRC